VNGGWSSRLLTGLLAGTDDDITAAFRGLSSAQRVRLARLVCDALEDAILRHARQDPAAPVLPMIEGTAVADPGVLHDTGLRVPGKTNAAGAWLSQLIRESRDP
jgi:hypothetical protein